jgi:hypothetical protein
VRRSIDMVFIGLWPRSVKSPLVILGHHLCTSLFLLLPYHYPQHQRMMGYCMLVEVRGTGGLHLQHQRSAAQHS